MPLSLFQRTLGAQIIDLMEVCYRRGNKARLTLRRDGKKSMMPGQTGPATLAWDVMKNIGNKPISNPHRLKNRTI